MDDLFFDISKPFEVPRLKMIWGKRRHTVALQQALREFQTKAKLTAGAYPVGVMARPPEFPAHVCLLLGDAIHNLRTALDLLACDVVRVNGKSTKGVYFPFAESEAGLSEQIKGRKFNRAPPEAIELLYKIQPYRGGNALLRALHDLDIMDKHQIIMPVTHMATARDARISFDGGFVEMRGVSFTPGMVQFGGGRPSTLSGSIEIESQFGLAAPTPVVGREVLATLESMAQIVEDVIKAFSNLFAGRGFPPGSAPTP